MKKRKETSIIGPKITHNNMQRGSLKVTIKFQKDSLYGGHDLVVCTLKLPLLQLCYISQIYYCKNSHLYIEFCSVQRKSHKNWFWPTQNNNKPTPILWVTATHLATNFNTISENNSLFQKSSLLVNQLIIWILLTAYVCEYPLIAGLLEHGHQ